jgi:Family of unknown function (DUF5675)
MVLLLQRTYQKDGTNGELTINGKRVCSTIELPWKQNRSRISCIPEGRYELRKRYTTRFGWHLLVVNVPGRDWILIHAANDALKEIKGCIAPVSQLTGSGKGILSRIALQKLMSIVTPVLDKQQPLCLIIKEKQQ